MNPGIDIVSGTIEAAGPVTLVHGGAWNIPPHEGPAHEGGMEHALRAARDVLHAGGPAVEAVCRAVAAMESDGAFDAGRGAVLNREGFVELDAGIMDGSALHFGSVAGMRSHSNPILIAKRILERGERQVCFLAGEGAEVYARRAGFEAIDPESLICERERLRYEALCAEAGFHTSHPFLPADHPRGTVGCVALDLEGRLAAATSTGGTPFRPAGRVGDSPMPGCGFYANRHAAASATGWGEAIASVVLCKDAVDRVQRGRSVQEAAEEVLKAMGETIRNREGAGATGGIILLDGQGRGAWAFSTPVMARGGWSRSAGLFTTVWGG